MPYCIFFSLIYCNFSDMKTSFSVPERLTYYIITPLLENFPNASLKRNNMQSNDSCFYFYFSLRPEKLYHAIFLKQIFTVDWNYKNTKIKIRPFMCKYFNRIIVENWDKLINSNIAHTFDASFQLKQFCAFICGDILRAYKIMNIFLSPI